MRAAGLATPRDSRPHRGRGNPRGPESPAKRAALPLRAAQGAARGEAECERRDSPPRGTRARIAGAGTRAGQRVPRSAQRFPCAPRRAPHGAKRSASGGTRHPAGLAPASRAREPARARESREARSASLARRAGRRTERSGVRAAGLATPRDSRPHRGRGNPRGPESPAKRAALPLRAAQGAARSEAECERRDSNPHAVKRCHLKTVCLPIPPRSRHRTYNTAPILPAWRVSFA